MIVYLYIKQELTNMKKGSRGAKRQDVCLRVDPDSPERILISTHENEAENGVRYRRRTTSFKGRRPTEKRRASLPAFYKLNIKPKATRKNLIQKIGSRLAKIGDELVQRNGISCKASKDVVSSCENESKTVKQYARQLADIGDYLNAVYSTESSLVYSENYNTTLAENCLVLTSILIGLKNNNIVVVNASDLNTLSSICRVHRAKSFSRARK